MLDDRLLYHVTFYCSGVYREQSEFLSSPPLKACFSVFSPGKEAGLVRLVKVNCFCSGDRVGLSVPSRLLKVT